MRGIGRLPDDPGTALFAAAIGFGILGGLCVLVTLVLGLLGYMK